MNTLSSILKGRVVELEFLDNHDCTCLKLLDNNKNIVSTDIIENENLIEAIANFEIDAAYIENYLLEDFISVSKNATAKSLVEHLILHLHLIGKSKEETIEIIKTNNSLEFDYKVDHSSIGLPFVNAIFFNEVSIQDAISSLSSVAMHTGKKYIIRIKINECRKSN